MKLQFHNPKELDKNLKATVHITGKLGFTIEAAKKMQFESHRFMSIASNGEDENDTSLYIVMSETKKDNSFNIAKAGQYYSVNTKALFDVMKLNYKTHTIMYDISIIDVEGEIVYKLSKREKPKKKDETEW